MIIFDQTWDKGKVERRHKGAVVGSEPDMFIGMANRIPDWGAVVGLIGTTRDTDGEESGLQQWVDQIQAKWRDMHLLELLNNWKAQYNHIQNHC